MYKEMERYVEEAGKEAARRAFESYRREKKEVSPEIIEAIYYSAGFTSAALTKVMADKWVQPLKKRARAAMAAAAGAIFLLVAAIAYSWSIVDFSTFSKFLLAFVPALATLLFTLSKAYKTWAEARKTLVEARQIEGAEQTGAKVLSKS